MGKCHRTFVRLNKTANTMYSPRIMSEMFQFKLTAFYQESGCMDLAIGTALVRSQNRLTQRGRTFEKNPSRSRAVS